MNIGEKILELRKKCNLSQESLAEKVGVTRQTISNWELNESSPDLKQSKKLSEIFNVSLDELVDNDIKDVLVTKVSNTEKLTNTVIKTLKVLAIIFFLFCVAIIASILCMTYFETTPVSSGVRMYCTINGEEQYYEVIVDVNNPMILKNFTTTDDKIKKELHIDIEEYNSAESLLQDVENYITSKGGKCRE